MTRIGERRVQAAIRKANGHKKGVLLANHYAENRLLGKPLLTTGEIRDIVKEMSPNAVRDTERDLPDDDERREFVSMMRAEDDLFLCLLDAKVAYLEVLPELTLLQGFLALVAQRRHAKGHLWGVCYRCNVERNATLFERGVSVDQLVPPASTSLEEESDSTTQTDVEEADEGVVAIYEVIERLKLRLSILKALTEVMRDFMDQRQIPITVFSETINWYDQHIGEFISGMKRIFYGTLFPEGEEQKASLIEQADPHVMMMETLPEYEDIPFDEDVYDCAWSLLSGRTL